MSLAEQRTIGLTGGIGSGKSFVAKILNRMGFPVFNSDTIAKEILFFDHEVLKKVVELTGTQVLNEANHLDKLKLSEIVFQNKEIRLKINEIIHPLVRERFTQWSLEQNNTLVFNEAAILYETGAYKRFEAMILVCAPMELRMQRIMSRDLCTKDQALARINAQWTDEQKIAFIPLLL